MHKSAVGFVLLFAACDPGDVVLLTPETSGPKSPSLAVRAVIDTPYAAVAESLSWAAGVPDAQVRVHRMDEPYIESYWHVATADSTGFATFPALLGGLYEVEVTRPLSTAETVKSGAGLRILAGGRRMYLSASHAEVTMAPDQRGSLVFSELSTAGPRMGSEGGGVEYPDSKYFEVYNNTDTTIYLDGKYWGIGWDLPRDYPYWPCAQTEAVRNDPQGIWAARILRFPGQGTDYPLAPGQTALIAKSAIDHRSVDPGFDDLSRADFEWGGYRNADNPDVPNLQDIGLRPMQPIWPGDADMPEFLSEPVDLTVLPRYVDPYSGYTWVRIPAATILDAWVGVGDQSVYTYTYPSCLEATHRYFERLPGPAGALADWHDGLSAQRRVLRILPDGRRILQDTNTSMADFVKALRTPGWIPDSLPGP